MGKMKIQCDVCEKAPATVICCADEAALCAKCDIEVHAANKLASKHQRLLLQCLSNKLPKCDICQVIHFINKPHFDFYILFIITIVDGSLPCIQQIYWYYSIHLFSRLVFKILSFNYVKLQNLKFEASRFGLRW